MFVPSLAVGAAGGRLAGRLVQAAIRSAGSVVSISLNSYAVIGEWRGDEGRGESAAPARLPACGLFPFLTSTPSPAGAAAFLGGSTRMTLTTTGAAAGAGLPLPRPCTACLNGQRCMHL